MALSNLEDKHSCKPENPFPSTSLLCQHPAALSTLSQARHQQPQTRCRVVSMAVAHFKTAIFDSKKTKPKTLFSWGRSQDNTLKAGEVKGFSCLGVLIPSWFLAQWAHVYVQEKSQLEPKGTKLSAVGYREYFTFKTTTHCAVCPLTLQRTKCSTLRGAYLWCKEPHFSPDISQGTKLPFPVAEMLTPGFILY